MKLDTPDRTFSEFLGQRNLGADAVALATNYVEGFNAADASRISVHSLAKQQAAEDAIEGDRLFRVAEGYAEVPAFLLRRFLDAGGEWVPSSPVRSIGWKPGRVEVATASERAFHAAAAIITLPLGVLQARRVSFVPQPREILDAADRLAMGPVARVVYEFDPRFWDRFASLGGVSFVFAPEFTPPTWWTTNPQPSSLLTGWVAGRKAGKLTIAGLPETGLATLAGIFGSSPSDIRQYLVRWHLHDWQADVRSLGAYTYVPRGAIQASDELSVPVEGDSILRRRAYGHQRSLGYRTRGPGLRLSRGGTGTRSPPVSGTGSRWLSRNVRRKQMIVGAAKPDPPPCLRYCWLRS